MAGPVATAVAPTATQPHLGWADNLRVTLIAGVIVAHVATAYVVDVDWYYEERTTSDAVMTALSFPVFLAAVFGLGPLFLLAGALSVGSLRRKGPGAFVRGRLLRLGVPVVVFTLLIDPVTDWLGSLGTDKGWTLWDCLTNATGARDFGPMWFVVALLVFSLLYAAWRWVRPLTERPRSQVIGRWTLAGFAAAIAVGSWLTWLHWTYVGETPVNANFGHWPQAAGLFALGVVAGERDALPAFPMARARRLGWVALAGVLVLTVVSGTVVAADDLDALVGGAHWQAVTFAAVAGVVSVALSLWLVTWFRERWEHQGPMARRAGRGSYAAYVIHPTVLVLVSLAAMALPWPPEAKFVLVASVGVPLTFLAGYRLTRVPGVRRLV